MKIYSIKYIETRGIQERDGCEVYQPAGEEVRYATRNTTCIEGQVFQRLGTECFETIEEARKAAAEKIRRQIKSCQKREAKLQKMLPGFES